MLRAAFSTRGAKFISDVTFLIALQLQQELIWPRLSETKRDTINPDLLV